MERSTFNLDELRVRNLNVTSHFWSDDGMYPLPISFPAKLNLEGNYNHIILDLDVEDQEYVSHLNICIINFVFFFFPCRNRILMPLDL